MAGTTVAPVDDPGWNYVSTGGRNLVYLGDGWLLSAFHVGVPSPIENLVFNGNAFNVIPNQTFVVRNQPGEGLTTDTDLRMMRINGDPGLTPLPIASQQLFEASTPLGPSREVIIVGNGLTRMPDLTSWDVEVGEGDNDDVWSQVVGTTGEYVGYRADQPAGLAKRWGTNQLADEDTVFETNDDDLRGQLPLALGVGERDVISLLTQFDSPTGGGLTNEAQAVSNDSGSAVFSKASGQWELLGIINANITYENQPGPTAIYGNYTTFADMTYYRPDILRIMSANPNYSVLGDVNLDGVVSGTTIGGVPTGDLAAFVSGWGSDNGFGVGSVTTWKNGDLNRDGRTDYLDFVLLRSAFNATGVEVKAEELFGHAVIPEPASLAMALIACTAWAPGRRSGQKDILTPNKGVTSAVPSIHARRAGTATLEFATSFARFAPLIGADRLLLVRDGTPEQHAASTPAIRPAR